MNYNLGRGFGGGKRWDSSRQRSGLNCATNVSNSSSTSSSSGNSDQIARGAGIAGIVTGVFAAGKGLFNILHEQKNTSSAILDLKANIKELGSELKESDAKHEARQKESDAKHEARLKESDAKHEASIKELRSDLKGDFALVVSLLATNKK